MPADAVDILRCHCNSITFLDGAKPVFADAATRTAVERAAKVLRAGQLVAFPTETVYGLGASALSADAVKRIYEAKRRPADNPLIVHVASEAMLHTLLESLSQAAPPMPPSYAALMRTCWPGPLSFLFPLPTNAKRELAATATASLPTFVARLPAHPIARALIALADVPVAAPSANTSGRPSPTLASHVADDMRAAHASDPAWSPLLVLDGGACGVGVESTVVDGVTSPERLRVLRLGGVSPEELRAVLDAAGLGQVEIEVAEASLASKEAPRTPGMKYRHYAPTCRVVLLDVVDDETAPALAAYIDDVTEDTVGWLHPDPSRLRWPAAGEVWRRSLGGTAEEHARRLFAHLRAAEDAGVGVVFVELPASSWRSGLGLTVAERLGKAARGDAAVTEIARVRP
jgi:L-threonylcarbamoyladenylate synthase